MREILDKLQQPLLAHSRSKMRWPSLTGKPFQGPQDLPIWGGTGSRTKMRPGSFERLRR